MAMLQSSLMGEAKKEKTGRVEYPLASPVDIRSYEYT